MFYQSFYCYTRRDEKSSIFRSNEIERIEVLNRYTGNDFITIKFYSSIHSAWENIRRITLTGASPLGNWKNEAVVMKIIE